MSNEFQSRMVEQDGWKFVFNLDNGGWATFYDIKIEDDEGKAFEYLVFKDESKVYDKIATGSPDELKIICDSLKRYCLDSHTIYPGGYEIKIQWSIESEEYVASWIDDDNNQLIAQLWVRADSVERVKQLIYDRIESQICWLQTLAQEVMK